MMSDLVFQKSPNVELGSNHFIGVPIVLQFEGQPLVEIIQTENAGYTTRIPIFHKDGTYLAKVVGSRLFTTPAGDKAGLTLTYPDKMTVCKLGDQVLFEIRRKDAASLKTEAELYTPTGHFVKYTDSKSALIKNDGSSIELLGVKMSGNVFQGCRIGVWIQSDGSISMGCN